MAIYHLNLKTIGRSDGRSATGAAAYRAGCRIEDQRTGLLFDYTRKRGCHGAEVLAPTDAPAWARSRAELWNHVEAVEKRKDAQLAREIEFALPIELTPEAMKNAARAFVREQFVALGMVADLAFHHLDGRNPHAHCLLTLRSLSPEGFGPKERAWNDRAMCDRWREAWARHANDALAQAGRAERIDHRPLTEQALAALDSGALAVAMALDRLPMVHEARDASAVAMNRTIRLANRVRASEWASIEREASAEARLMASNTDHRPKAAAPAAPAVPIEQDARDGRPEAARGTESDAQFRLAMERATGLTAAAWRAADRDAEALRNRLAEMDGESERRFEARQRAERMAQAAKLERRLFLERNPRPRGFWIFNRGERLAWAARLKRRDNAVRRAEKARVESIRAADTAAILSLESQRFTIERRLARALAERQRHGCLPSEAAATRLAAERARAEIPGSDSVTVKPSPAAPRSSPRLR